MTDYEIAVLATIGVLAGYFPNRYDHELNPDAPENATREGAD
jgi:hypothetical protein